jgi:hypothetical protein
MTDLADCATYIERQRDREREREIIIIRAYAGLL